MKDILKRFSNEKKTYNICALGNTGVGKSSLLNMLGNVQVDEKFEVGAGANAQTNEVECKYKTFLGDPSEINLCLVDTQGLWDPLGDQKDIQNIRSMVTAMRRLKTIDLFLYCIEETNPRFTSYIQETITLFDSIFPDFLDHTVLVFNKSDKEKEMQREKLANQWNDTFKRVFGLPNDKEIQCFFLNSNVAASKQLEYDNQAGKLKEYLIHKKTECDVILIEPKQTVRGKLKEEMERLQKELEEQRLVVKKQEEELIREKKKRDKLKKTVAIAGG